MKETILEIKEQEDLESVPKHILLFKIFKQMFKIIFIFFLWISCIFMFYFLVTGKFLDYVETVHQIVNSLGL
ncbi:hypothetical protein [uncultured Clostridium sp.]|uniref:hypothetical protein n=1 Tax=uncultured Clostridium sp. TaxID=59620 RepID=UPI0028E8E43F|nr:hypothetical protein [uncultured Clostridium sp.]